MEQLGSAPSASLGEGTLVGLCYADVVEPVERHVAVSGGIQEEPVVCSFPELRVSLREVSSFAGGASSREASAGLGARDREKSGMRRGRVSNGDGDVAGH